MSYRTNIFELFYRLWFLPIINRLQYIDVGVFEINVFQKLKLHQKIEQPVNSKNKIFVSNARKACIVECGRAFTANIMLTLTASPCTTVHWNKNANISQILNARNGYWVFLKLLYDLK